MTRTTRSLLAVGAAVALAPLGACGHSHPASTTHTTVVHHVTVPVYHTPVFVASHHVTCHTVTTYTYKRVSGKLKKVPTGHHSVCS
jgi:hypothetical protein